MKLANRLQGINEYYFSQKLREIDGMNREGKNIINLGIGSPDLPPHPSVVETLAAESLKPGQHGYQNYKGSPVLRKAIANWYQRWYNVTVDADREVLPLIGSKEGIMHICMTYLEEGDTALIPDPGYPTYSAAVKLAGGSPVVYQLTAENSWRPDWEELEQLVQQNRCKLFFVNYPHMPTGELPAAEVFEKLVAFAQQHDLLLVHDNPYSFILNDHPRSILAVPGAKEVTLELNSLSKSHNMAGWRVGMLIASEEHINEVLRFKSNMDSGMFLPLQLAAAKALELGQDWHDELNAIYRQRRQKAFELLELLGCSFNREQAGLFVWAKVNEAKDAGDGNMGAGGRLSDQVLYNAQVFITPGGIFGTNGNGYVRVSLCCPVEKFEEAIKRIKERL
ncbi:MAG: aminotransferase class I/II-fold pyridoxal phosphate-dependent enzyme [Ferruginibacter sp.]